jgi:predicted Zn-dependent protease
MMRRSVLFAAVLAAACSGRGPPRAPGGGPEADGAQPRPEVLVARARALRADGDMAGARARLEAALEIDPGLDDARLDLADLLIADGREVERAALLLEEVGAKGSERHALLSARLAESRGDDAVAADAYGRALALADDPDARLRRALALERLGRGDEATAELERVRAERPDDAVARSRLAERYEASGRLLDAEKELRRLAEDQPDRAAGWERLARFYARHGRAADARAAMARARAASGRPGRSLRPLLPSKR